jgi:hypothetical protein
MSHPHSACFFSGAFEQGKHLLVGECGGEENLNVSCL